MSAISSATSWRVMGYQNTHDAQDPWSKKIQYLKAQYKYFMDFSWDRLSVRDAIEISKYLLIDILSEKSIAMLKHTHPSFSQEPHTRKQKSSSKIGKKTTKLQKLSL